MPVRGNDEDPVRDRLRERAYRHAYESWMKIVTERASRAVPHGRPKVSSRSGDRADRSSLAS